MIKALANIAFFIFIFFGSLAYIDIPKLIKKKQRRELAVYSAFLILGFMITILHQVFNFEFSAFTRWFIRLISNI